MTLRGDRTTGFYPMNAAGWAVAKAAVRLTGAARVIAVEQAAKVRVHRNRKEKR
jgi:hypothetical protein